MRFIYASYTDPHNSFELFCCSGDMRNNIRTNPESITVDSVIICRLVGFGGCLGWRAGAGLLFFLFQLKSPSCLKLKNLSSWPMMSAELRICLVTVLSALLGSGLPEGWFSARMRV